MYKEIVYEEETGSETKGEESQYALEDEPIEQQKKEEQKQPPPKRKRNFLSI